MYHPSPPRRGRKGGTTRARLAAGIACALSFIVLASLPGEAVADELPPGFYETSVITGSLDVPTALAFAPDGDVFVAEKDGMLLRFDGLDDSTPETVLDFRDEANNFGDRGFLGLALDPNYATNHYAYISYTYDAPVGGTAPTHALPPPRYDDSCVNQCEVTARIERLDLSGTTPVPRTVLIQDDYCNQYQSHSIGTLAFDSQRRLYVGGGDGASYIVADYGQATGPDDPEAPWNPCGDPGGPEGSPLSLPDAEGGALRSQDHWTTSDPLGLSGTIIRIDPDTGAGDPDNPLYNSAAPTSNESRMLAYGFRNPFRFTVSPDDGRVWLGDAGWKSREEIDSFSTASPTVPNFGWPCYEGAARQPEYDPLNLTLCENLYAAGPGAVEVPTFEYDHHEEVYPGDPCPVPGDGSASSGIAFYTGDSFPSEYDGSLFFTDYARHCIWRVPVDPSGNPLFGQTEAFDQHVIAPVDLKVGPDGALYYVDIGLAEIRRIQHTAGNTPPQAVATATPEFGSAPLEVDFDATGSTDADAGDTLTYEWDLNGDGDYSDPQDSTSATPTHTYNSPETVDVHLRVSDGSPETDTDTIRVDVGNHPPAPSITSPAPGSTWTVGQQLNFHGVATDAEQGTLPPSALRWDVILEHCVPGGGCHDHHQTTLDGDDDLQITAPDHGYPAHLSIELTATDNKGLARRTTLDLQPNTVNIQSQSVPSGLILQLGDVTGPAPQTLTAIQGSQVQAIAQTTQTLSATSYNWCQWSDGASRIHSFTAATSMTLTATYAPNCPPTDLALSGSSFAENQGSGATVGALSTTDPDGGAHTYSLVGGTGDTDNARFQIDGSTLKTSGSFDFETKSSYSVRIRTHDGSTGFAKAFAITVTNANDAPTGILLSDASVDENQPSGATVGALSSTDQDVGDSHSYSLVSGAGSADNASFTVDGTSLKTAASFNYEARSSYSIRVKSDDSAGGAFEQQLTVTVSDVNEPTTEIALSNSAVEENLPLGSVVGAFSSADPDATPHTYALVSGSGADDNANFAISGTELRTAATFDHEQGATYSIRVRSENGSGDSFERRLDITVTDVNEPPSAPTISSAWVAENLPAGSLVANLASDDPDASDNWTFTLVDGDGSADNADFQVSGSTLVTSRPLDFEADPVRDIRLAVKDSKGLSAARAFAIAVADVEDLPSNITLSNASVGEHMPAGSAVGDLAADDQDAGDSSAFTLVPGPGAENNGEFAISGTSLFTATELERKHGAVRSVRIRATDQFGGVLEREFTIVVLEGPLELDVVRFKVPGRPSQLLRNGVRVRLGCSTECRVRIELRASGRVARKLGIRGIVGSKRVRLGAGQRRWVTAKLERRYKRRLAAYEGRRMPKITPSFAAKER